MAAQGPLTGGLPDPFVDRLRREVAEWTREGIITEDTRRLILARYGAEYQQRVGLQRQGRLTQVISALGAVLVGTGVILFIGANWEAIPTALKLVLIFGSIVLADGVGLWLRAIEYGRTGTALLLLGALLYGAGLALVGQIYNIEAGSGTLFLLWALGVLASGLALASELLLSLSALLFAAWTLFVRIGGASDVFAPFGGLEETLHMPYLAALAGLLIVAYHLRQERLLAANLLGGSLWLALALTQWRVDPFAALLFCFVLGASLVALGAAHLGARPRVAEPYVLFGVPFVLVPTYLLSFDSIARQVHRPVRGGIATAFWIVLAALAATAVVVALVLAFRSRLPDVVRLVLLGLAGLVPFALLFLLWPGLPLPALAWNIALAVESLALIAVGYFLHERRFVNAGLTWFVLLVMSRYFDVFALYFGTYASFMIGGVLFIALAFALEHLRRRLLRQMAQRAPGGGGRRGAV